MEIHLSGNNTKESNIIANNTSMKEDSINKKKRRVAESPVINKVGSTPVTITLNELMKISPQLRTQYKKDLAAMRTEYEDIEDKVIRKMTTQKKRKHPQQLMSIVQLMGRSLRPSSILEQESTS